MSRSRRSARRCASGAWRRRWIISRRSPPGSPRPRWASAPTTTASRATSPTRRSTGASLMAKALGAPVITASAQQDVVPRVAVAARKHKMLVAMHNHSEIHPNEFATPADFEKAMTGAGARVHRRQPGHRPLHRRQLRRRGLPEEAPPAHRHPAHQGSEARPGGADAVRRGRRPDPRRCCSCCASVAGRSRRTSNTNTRRRHRRRGQTLPGLLPERPGDVTTEGRRRRPRRPP